MRTFKEAFPDLFNWEVDAAFSDHSDNVRRCPLCHWELEEGRCLHCFWTPSRQNHQFIESDSHVEDDTTDTEARLAREFIANSHGHRERRYLSQNDDDAFYSADSEERRPSDDEFVVPDSEVESIPEPDDEEEDYSDFVTRTRFDITQNTVAQSHEFTEFGSDDDDHSDDSEPQQSMLWRPGSDRFRAAQSLGHHTGVPETPPPPYPYPEAQIPGLPFEAFRNMYRLANGFDTRASPRRLRSNNQINYPTQSFVAPPQQQQSELRSQAQLQSQSQQQQPSNLVLNERQRHELGTLTEPPIGNSLAERMQQRREAAVARRRAQPNSRSQRPQPEAGTTANNPVDLSTTPHAPHRHRGRRNQPIIINDEEDESEHNPVSTADNHPVEDPDDLEGPEVLTYSAAGYLEHDPSDHRPEVDMYRTQIAYHSRENDVYQPRRIRIFDNDSDEETRPNQQRQNQRQQQRQRIRVQSTDSDSDESFRQYTRRPR